MTFIHCRSLVVLALAIASIAQTIYPSPTYAEVEHATVGVHDQEFQRRHNGNEGSEGQFTGPDSGYGQNDHQGSGGRFSGENKDSDKGNIHYNRDDQEGNQGRDKKEPSKQETKTSQEHVDDDGNSGNKRPTPSQSQRARNVQRRNFDSMTPSEIATAVCPENLSGCPIAKAGSNSSLPATYSAWLENDFECADFEADLRSCGGCASLDIKHDCTAIPGALDVACDSGVCVVHSCKPGFTFNTTTSACTRNRN